MSRIHRKSLMEHLWFIECEHILSSWIVSNEELAIKTSNSNEIYGSLNGANVSDICGFIFNVTKRLTPTRNDIFLRLSRFHYLLLFRMTVFYITSRFLHSSNKRKKRMALFKFIQFERYIDEKRIEYCVQYFIALDKKMAGKIVFFYNVTLLRGST